MQNENNVPGADDKSAPVTCDVCNSPFIYHRLDLTRANGNTIGTLCDSCASKLISLLTHLGDKIFVVEPGLLESEPDTVVRIMRRVISSRLISGPREGLVSGVFISASQSGKIFVQVPERGNWCWSSMRDELVEALR